MKYTEIREIIFTGKQNIHWSDVETYLRKYDGMEVMNSEYGDIIKINSVFADEYAHSNYTKKLRGGLAKTKANLAQIVPELVASASNRRWVENKSEKHDDNAIRGWYRYDAFFSMKVYNSSEKVYKINFYSTTVIVRINDSGMYLHDIINIKKEARKPMDS